MTLLTEGPANARELQEAQPANKSLICFYYLFFSLSPNTGREPRTRFAFIKIHSPVCHASALRTWPS